MRRVEDYWSYFASEARKAGSPLYGYLAECIGQDEDLKSLAARARPGQPRANMLLGAVHFLLLRGDDHALKQFYPTLGGEKTLEDADPFELFVEFVHLHQAQIARLIETRTTNTNEVGRSALLHPGFRCVYEQARARLALIEIGPSAGLNMLWDQYGVRYWRDDAVVLQLGPKAPLVIDCVLKSERLPPSGPLPAVVARRGLELNPNDLNDADNRDWLCALVWPEHVDRLNRLKTAVALGRAAALDIRAGDALENLMAAIADLPRDAAVCVYHTVALYQFSGAMKQTLEDLLTVAGLRRTVFRLSFELGADLRHLLSLRRYEDGSYEDQLLAEGQPHGAWMEWLA